LINPLDVDVTTGKWWFLVPAPNRAGGGTQTPIIRCVRENPLRYYSQRRCAHARANARRETGYK
ncbi:hypothetical protein DOY81_011950, partial [Sarcophaga bullata]